MKKNLFILSLYFCTVGAMEEPKAHQTLNDLIQSKSTDQRYQNPAYITFIQAKAKATANQLEREISTLSESSDAVYTRKDACAIIQESCDLFNGTKKEKPVFGYLDVLENLECDLRSNKDLDKLNGRLYELERAIKLAKSGKKIQEFGAQIKIKENERSKLQAEHGAHLLMDIDIYALDEKNEPILEEVKSFKYCSTQAEQELKALITGMKLLWKYYQIPCTLHTKYALPNLLQKFCKNEQVQFKSDFPHIKMTKPTSLVRPRMHNDSLLIEKEYIKIKNPDCIVCYQEVEPHQETFIRELEDAHIAYIQTFLKNEKLSKSLSYNLKKAVPIAQTKLSLTSGFLNPILTSLATYAEQGNWTSFRTTAFEILCALDMPENKKVVALGAQLFFNPKNNLLKGPSYIESNGSYFKEKKETTGYDIDVLVQDTEAPHTYTIIEATTGPSTIKGFEKFRTMGKYLDAEVYILHNFNDDENFTRTAYLKKPVAVCIGQSVSSFPWELISRSNQYLQQLNVGKDVYRQLSLKLDGKKITEKLVKMYPEFKQKNNEELGKKKNIILKNVINNIQALFTTIDNVHHQANEDAYKYNIQKKLLELMKIERQNNHLGSSAFAVLCLLHLDCTIAPELQERYLPAHSNHKVNINNALQKALAAAIKDDAAQAQVFDENKTLIQSDPNLII